MKANDRMVKPSGGVAMPTTPAPSEKIATATGQPAAVRSNIQRVAGSVHASPTMNEIEKRRLRSFPAMSSNQSAMPTRVSGHQPHGGRPAAMSRPAGMARRWGRELTGCGARGVRRRARRDSDVGPLRDGRSNQARASGSHTRVRSPPPTALFGDRPQSAGQTRLPQTGQGWRPRSLHRARVMASCHQRLTSTGSMPTSQGKCRSATPFQVGWSNW